MVQVITKSGKKDYVKAELLNHFITIGYVICLA